MKGPHGSRPPGLFFAPGRGVRPRSSSPPSAWAAAIDVPYQAEAPGRARVAARRGLLCVASDLPGSSFLEITAVGLACLTGYKSRLTALLQWSSTHRLHWSGHNELDTVLVSYFDKMYFEGPSSADESKTLAAIKHFKPEVGRHGPLSFARRAGFVRPHGTNECRSPSWCWPPSLCTLSTTREHATSSGSLSCCLRLQRQGRSTPSGSSS